MEIGDKLYFDTYLPINTAGYYETTYNEVNGRRRRLRQWSIEMNLDTGMISWIANKITIKKQQGIFIGTFKKKLRRDYRSAASRIAEQEPTLALDNRFHVREIVRGRREFVRTDRPSRNPNRLDNPRQLSTLAIIATSKTKRYVVDMNDLNRCNLQGKIKIL